MNRDLNYEKNNIGFNYLNGVGIKCKNYIVCGDVVDFECTGDYLCIGCDLMFGTWGSGENLHTGKGILEISDDLECPICLEVKQCISQSKCNHSLCISCFKRCYYGDENREGEPLFPYPDIEDEYFDNVENIKWVNDYPLIKIYHDEFNKWYNEKTEKRDNEEYLSICSICRK